MKTIELEGAFDVLAIDNGTDAIRLVRSTNFDCVFLDLSIPGVTGYDVLEEIGGGSVPVVVVTAHDQKRTRDRALGLAARGDEHFFR